ncbi:Rossmann-like and DUF2520 domain-containing protein [Oceanihabitans sediminis]|uniref:DUF2520 domain-containing protein n=1 Tax=Oceanihabitans sediminis TaxID=1812012 RepID=A0A368P5Z9_9FLAO|nr:DUF2520 domain-containing protein [Oceanihabitans sediminis]MDX1278834.1 DUF2520 domain-containing protein [Oceanihabitans sediminis]MDX1773309.1 DUF2520 domain-containing protein [Oceanihabitans sediminis]RBP32741.1 putative short-subunit dehydrogenase-like oxidoreductase (DUF2520 family) [Oceanihabitans sediminis]RCU57720.1 DUF2520 domain-containing protein [Oceanihabitans sediminis]
MIHVVLLGAGNVATHLYKAFEKSGEVTVKQWYNRNLKTIETYKNQVTITNDLSKLVEADIYILAVSDDAVSEISAKLPFENRLVVHTSGSVSVYDIDMKHKRGVFYPLQTFSKGASIDFSQIPLCVEAIKSKEDLPILKKLAKAIGSKPHRVNSDQRASLHLAAVYVNNFTNQIYRIAHEITESTGADFEILKPLIKETARKLDDLTPYLAQTGPAKRNDKKTIKKHKKALTDPIHKEVYQLLTKSIQKTHGI